MTLARLQTLLATAGVMLASALILAPLCSNDLQRGDSAGRSSRAASSTLPA